MKNYFKGMLYIFFASSIVILVAILMAFIIHGMVKPFLPKPQQHPQTIGRFDQLEPFYLLDGRDEQGMILKDRREGECYLYVWNVKGGTAITKINCGE